MGYALLACFNSSDTKALALNRLRHRRHSIYTYTEIDCVLKPLRHKRSVRANCSSGLRNYLLSSSVKPADLNSCVY